MHDASVRRRENLTAGGGILTTEHVPGVRSVALGVWVRTGSRDEPAAAQGITHFIEHMLFKGTARRSAHDIARSLEQVGGVLDAFTTREYTCYFARVLGEHVALACDVLGDCLRHSVFAAEQVEREKRIVEEEILSYEDAPEDCAGDRLAELVWQGHPLGSPILGTRETVRAFEAATVRRRFAATYRGPATVVAAAGDLEHERLRELAERHLALPGGGAAPRRAAVPLGAEPASLAIERDLGQLTVAAGAPGLAYGDPRRPALELLNAILGGSMSSRIFQRVREEAGLAYSVYTDVDSYEDAGLFMCGLAVSPGAGRRAVRLVMEEIGRFCRDGLRPGELEAAKSQWRGGLLLGLESTTQRLGRLAKGELYRDGCPTVAEEIARIERVSATEVVEVARQLLRPESFSLVTMGPLPAGPLQRDDLLVPLAGRPPAAATGPCAAAAAGRSPRRETPGRPRGGSA